MIAQDTHKVGQAVRRAAGPPGHPGLGLALHALLCSSMVRPCGSCPARAPFSPEWEEVVSELLRLLR